MDMVVKSINSNGFGRESSVLVDQKTIKIKSEEFVLTQRGYVKSTDLQIGDKIRAYSFHLPQKPYN